MNCVCHRDPAFFEKNSPSQCSVSSGDAPTLACYRTTAPCPTWMQMMSLMQIGMIDADWNDFDHSADAANMRAAMYRRSAYQQPSSTTSQLQRETIRPNVPSLASVVSINADGTRSYKQCPPESEVPEIRQLHALAGVCRDFAMHECFWI